MIIDKFCQEGLIDKMCANIFNYLFCLCKTYICLFIASSFKMGYKYSRDVGKHAFSN